MRQGVVKIVVTDAAARQRIKRLLEFHGVAVRQRDALPQALDPATMLLVHDLAPWDDDALGALHRLRRHHPNLQVLLYHPPTREACAIAGIAAQLPLTSTWPWRPDDADHGPLRDHLRALLVRSPTGWTLHHLCTTVFADARTPLRNFLTAAVDVLDHGGTPARAWARTIARRSGWSIREVERAAQDAHAPSPGRLLQWLALLDVALSREASGVSLARTAARIGLGAERFRRMRKRLLPSADSTAPLDVQTVVQAFCLAAGDPERDPALRGGKGPDQFPATAQTGFSVSPCNVSGLLPPPCRELGGTGLGPSS